MALERLQAAKVFGEAVKSRCKSDCCRFAADCPELPQTVPSVLRANVKKMPAPVHKVVFVPFLAVFARCRNASRPARARAENCASKCVIPGRFPGRRSRITLRSQSGPSHLSDCSRRPLHRRRNCRLASIASPSAPKALLPGPISWNFAPKSRCTCPSLLALPPSPPRFKSPTPPPWSIPAAPAPSIPWGARPSIRKWLPQPGRNLSDLVNQQPGWLYEANGVLHPAARNTMCNIFSTALPLTQNRSPAFAPQFDADDVDSMRVLTAAFPAEYGRKLGGVIEVTTVKDLPGGFHGQFDVNGGSFCHRQRLRRNFLCSRTKIASRSAATAFIPIVILIPPVLANLHQSRQCRWLFSFLRARIFRKRSPARHPDSQCRALPGSQRTRAAAIRPAPGHRQSRNQRPDFFPARHLPQFVSQLVRQRARCRARLTSNPLATPVDCFAGSRGYREGYARADLAGHHGRHNWKTGVDSLFTPVHEALQLPHHGSIAV